MNEQSKPVCLTTQRVRPLLGTLVAIGAEGGDRLETAISAAFGAVARVEALMRPRTVGSDVWRISAAGAGEVVRIDPWTYAVLDLARGFHRDSAGVFDPCRPVRSGRLADLELRTPDSVVCRAAVALDLGGIAKGFAVDRAVDELKGHGCVRGIVNAGGDLRCFGPDTQTVWLRHGAAEVTESSAAAEHSGASRIEISDCALAVSSARSARSPSEHVGYYLGTSGKPVAGQWTAIVAREAVVADALSKCVMLASSSASSRLLHAHGARVVRVAA
jgi:FAD:protein FMN transferase